jgi:hypothetical protein
MLLGISGKLGSGKNTAANALKEQWPVFELKSFAEKLKFITHYLTGCELEDTYTQEGKNKMLLDWGMTIGQFQQKLGTEAIRVGLHPQGWILALFADYKSTDNWIVTDVRFKNEAQAIKDRGGYLIRVDGDPAGIRANSTRDLNHPSETDLDDWTQWDVRYVNDGDIPDLSVAVCQGLKILMQHDHDIKLEPWFLESLGPHEVRAILKHRAEVKRATEEGTQYYFDGKWY